MTRGNSCVSRRACREIISSRDHERVCARLEIPAAGEAIRRAFIHHYDSLRVDFRDADSFFENEVESDAEQVVAA